jgi:hypothetical protein
MPNIYIFRWFQSHWTVVNKPCPSCMTHMFWAHLLKTMPCSPIFWRGDLHWPTTTEWNLMWIRQVMRFPENDHIRNFALSTQCPALGVKIMHTLWWQRRGWLSDIWFSIIVCRSVICKGLNWVVYYILVISQ